jgi:hypothetical protein
MSTSDKHEAKKILEKINVLISIFEKDGIENISEIEKSLLLEQIDNLRNSVVNIKKTTSEVIENQTATITQNIAEIPKPIVEVEAIELVEETIVEVKAPIIEEKTAEPVLEDEKEIEVAKELTKVEEPQIIEEEKVVETAVSTTKKTYNFPLRNMREIIDLNKSFVFKADLFKGNHEAYTKFVDELNHTEDEDEAMVLVEKYASAQNWDKEDNLYAVLVRSVEKRFLPIIG